MGTANPLLKGIAKLHGYAIFRRFLDRSQWWSADQRDAWIAKRLRSTLIGARAVPFYRDAFASVGFDPRVDFKSPHDLASLPLLSQQQVQQERDRLLDPTNRMPSIVDYTIGATGQRIAMLLNESFLAFDAACVLRHWSWAGYQMWQPVVALRDSVPENEDERLWRYSRAQNTMYLSAYHLTPQNCEHYIELVLAVRPAIIRGSPSAIAVLAEYAYSRRDELSFLSGVVASAGTLQPHERETIERTFGKKVFNGYGLSEPAIMLTECERHEGVHVNWEYGYAELLASPDLPPDEFRLVTTAFHNPAMPFIRYETGDIVRTFSDGRRCACGRTMPLLHSVSARKSIVTWTSSANRYATNADGDTQRIVRLPADAGRAESSGNQLHPPINADDR